MRVLVSLAATAAILLSGCSATDDETTGPPQTAEDDATLTTPVDDDVREPSPTGDSPPPIDCEEFLPIAADVIGGSAPLELSTVATDLVGVDLCEYDVDGVGRFSIRSVGAGETLPTPQYYAGDNAVDEVVEYPEFGTGAFSVWNPNNFIIFTPTVQVGAASYEDPPADVRSIGLGLVRAAEAYR